MSLATGLIISPWRVSELISGTLQMYFRSVQIFFISSAAIFVNFLKHFMLYDIRVLSEVILVFFYNFISNITSYPTGTGVSFLMGKTAVT
jgi:hypothetical protein